MNTNKNKKSADWFVQGVLGRVGGIVDQFTGREWSRSSNLSTSELILKLQMLLDSEVRNLGTSGKFVPHDIKLKVQWNKFSVESEESLHKLENELLAATIDHINNNMYHTYKPVRIEVKADYFVEGVKFAASFDEYGNNEDDGEISLPVTQLKPEESIVPTAEPEEISGDLFIAEYTSGKKFRSIELRFIPKKKRMTIGRAGINDITLDDPSVSKAHAAIVLNPKNTLLVADTGSTNGTFINGERIEYGRAFPISDTDTVRFGSIEIRFRRSPEKTDFVSKDFYSEAADEIADGERDLASDYRQSPAE